MTKDWLNKHNIYYDQLILTNAYNKHEKADKCIENKIDIMIDDSVRTCKDCINNCITTLLMDTPYNKYEQNITRVHNWNEIYKYIKVTVKEGQELCKWLNFDTNNKVFKIRFLQLIKD